MLTPKEVLVDKIIILRGVKVMLDADLATLYNVETKSLKRQVKRNFSRFPEDFMFQLTKEEVTILKRHFGTSSAHGGSRVLPFAFTEHGVLMLSSVLRSGKAIEINIAIMRIFLEMRNSLKIHQELTSLVLEHQEQIQNIRFELEKIGQEDLDKDKRTIGFRVGE